MWLGKNKYFDVLKKTKITADQAKAFLKRHKQNAEQFQYEDYKIHQIVFEVMRSKGCKQDDAAMTVIQNLIMDNRLADAEKVSDWLEREQMV